MNVIPQELIENVVAENMDTLYKMNPTTQNTGQATDGMGDNRGVTIRGFSSSNPIVNGISQAGSVYFNIPMMQDIERVEIINGATGFLYGGGRVGGAVNYITKKPTLDDLTTLTIGSYGGNSHYAHLDLSGQIDQSHIFGYRINTLYQGGENSADVKREQKAVSLTLDYKPIDNFYTDINYSYKDVDAHPQLLFRGEVHRQNIKKNKNYATDWTRNNTEFQKIENSSRWDINDMFTLRTNLMYADMQGTTESPILYDVKNHKIGSGSLVYFSPTMQTKHQGANIFLDSKFNTLDIDHTLSIGYSQNTARFYSGSWKQYILNREIHLNDLKNIPKPDIAIDMTKPLSNKFEYKNILIGDDITFNEQWSALIGGNYASIINTAYKFPSSYDKSVFTPTLSLIYKPTKNLTTYATYIESLEAGTIVGDQYENRNEILEPYISTQYELGAKYNLNDRALLTAALFRIEKANSYEVNKNGLLYLTQDGQQIHQGIELGITGKVTNHLTLMAGGTIMDLGIDKATIWGSTINGKKPMNAPAQMAKIFAEYQVPNIDGLYLNGGAYYTGKRYGDNANTDILPEYTLFDLGVRYQTSFGNYPTTFNLNATNLANKVYWTSGNYLGDPRTVAFSVKTRF